ncbi:MAG: hypothetical protein QG617_256, partial [Campylobacterota bacterium]|nr:hypothetical protein [Campylobacterota bacterium]
RDSKTEMNSFVQRYSIGYRGSAYSPKFLSYTLRTSLFLEDREDSTNNIKSNSNNRGETYDVNIDFIKDTFIPFSIRTAKTYTPYSSVIDGESTFTEQKTDTNGIMGSIKLRFFDINYGVSESQMETKSDITVTDIDKKDYYVTLYKSLEDKKIFLRHSYDEFKNQTSGYIDTISETKSRNLNGTFDWNPKKSIALSSYANQRDDITYDSKTTSGNINLRWVPTELFNISNSLSLINLESNNTVNDSVIFSESSSYKLSKEISLNQNLLLSTSQTDSQATTTTSDTYSLGVGVGYNKPISETLSFNANGGIDARVLDYESNTSSDQTQYNGYNLGAGFIKELKSINSKFHADSYLNGHRSSSSDDSDRISANLSLYTFLDSNIRNVLTATYSIDSSYYMQGTDDNLTKRDIQMQTITESIEYSDRIGFKGRYSLGAGISQSESAHTTNNETTKSTSTRPSIRATLGYNIWRSLIFNSSIDINQDAAYDMTNYQANASLGYNLRKIQMTLATNYLKRDEKGETISEQSGINFQISRPF